MTNVETPEKRKTMDVSSLAEVLGISRSSAYKLASENRLPVPVIRVGRRLVVSREAVDRLFAPECARERK